MRLPAPPRKLLHSAFSLTAFCIAAPAQPPEREPPIPLRDGGELAKPRIRVPVETHSGHIALSVKVNGQGPFRFQLDTGAGIELCVDLSLVKKLGLKKTGTTLNSAADPSKAVERDLVAIDEISFGGAIFRKRTALAADYRWVNKKKGQRVEGLLGFPLFRELLLQIDYPNNEIVLSKGQLNAKQRHVVSYRRQGRTPHVPLDIGKRRVWSLLDTGYGGSIVLPRSALKGLKLNGPLTPAGTGRTVNASFPVYRARLADELQLAGHSVVGVRATIYDHARYPLLGSRLFQHRELTFDQERSLLRIVSPQPRKNR